MNWKDAISDFKDYLKIERGLSINSIMSYEHDLIKLTKFLDVNKKIKPLQLDSEIIKEFIKHLSKDVSPSSQSRIISGHDEKYYYKVTFEMTKEITDLVYEINPNAMMTYVSGEGTSTQQKSKISWANVKGKAENYILNKGLRDSYMIRLGILIPENGIRPKTKIYNLFYTLIIPLYPILKLIPSITTSSKLGKAMINCFYYTSKEKYLDNKKINKLSTIHLKD